jgi:hypothetical protein
LLLGIYDGHGDDKVARYLQEHLLDRLSQHKLFDSDLETAIKSGKTFINSVLTQIEE